MVSDSWAILVGGTAGPTQSKQVGVGRILRKRQIGISKGVKRIVLSRKYTL